MSTEPASASAAAPPPPNKKEEKEETYAPIIPGGSLIIAYQLRGKRVLIVGGGNVAASRLFSVLCADAHITLISPLPLHPEILHRLQTHPHQITHIPRPFSASLDLPLDTAATTYSLVLTAIDDPVVSTEIYTLCHNLHIPVNVADVPSECDFYFGSIYRDGPVQVMVSTNGKGPRMAALIKDRIRDALGGGDAGTKGEGAKGVGEAVERIGELRKKLREVAGERELGPKRMQWISLVTEKWSLEELTGLRDEDIQRLLESWEVWKVEGGEVPGCEELRRR